MKKIASREICRYILVGCSGVACDYLLYNLLLHGGWGLGYAKMTSFCIGAGYVFMAQKYWTFRNNGHISKQLLRYVLLYAATAVLNTAINNMAIGSGCSYWIAFLLATGASTLGNFIGQKFFIFG